MGTNILMITACRVYLFFSILFISSKAYCQNKNKLCDYLIYLDEVKMSKWFGLTNDTAYLSDNSTYYFRAHIKTCKGDMYIERRYCSNDQLVFSGSYLGADKPDIVTGHTIDPVTGKSGRGRSIEYYPIKHTNRSYSAVVKNVFGLSSEGCEITGVYDVDKQLRKLKVMLYGVMGKIYKEYYLYNDALIYQKVITFTYDKPFYEKGYKMIIDSSYSNCIDDTAFNIEKNAFQKEEAK